MICRRHSLLLLLLLILPSGCTDLHAVTAPALDRHLATAAPIRLVTPLATVYCQDRDQDAPTTPARRGIALANASLKEINRQLTARGWTTGQPITVDWQDLAAGSRLPDTQTIANDRHTLAARRILRQLETIGRHLRNNERIDGIRQSDQQVVATDSKLLAGEGGSLLFAVVVGCDGRLTDGPCRNIQSPPLRAGAYNGGTFRTFPAGMALHLYWLDADSGRLLWYDTSNSFNAASSSAADISAITSATLAEFPAHP